tara:strand:- start:83066 stop:83674 length:609 start_codon:yes stop_codon:yes gene_type:complete
MEFVKDQTEKAITKEDINQAHFYTYKALKAIEKSKKQLESCSCTSATKAIEDSLENLIMATRASTSDSTRLLLNRALQTIAYSLKELEEHDLHKGEYDNDILEMNTVSEGEQPDNSYEPLDPRTYQERIDESLKKYQKSINHVIETVDCNKARAFAQRIYDNCEQKLLTENLSEEKKYYNLKTKEITKNALNQLKDCVGSSK